MELVTTDVQNVIPEYISKFKHHNDWYWMQIGDVAVGSVSDGLCIWEMGKLEG